MKKIEKKISLNKIQLSALDSNETKNVKGGNQGLEVNTFPRTRNINCFVYTIACMHTQETCDTTI